MHAPDVPVDVVLNYEGDGAEHAVGAESVHQDDLGGVAEIVKDAQ